MAGNKSNDQRNAIRTLIVIAVTTFVAGLMIGRPLHNHLCGVELSTFQMNFLRPSIILGLLLAAIWCARDELGGGYKMNGLRLACFYFFVAAFLFIHSAFANAGFADMHTSEDDFVQICAR